MKKIFTIIAAASLLFLAAPTASADDYDLITPEDSITTVVSPDITPTQETCDLVASSVTLSGGNIYGTGSWKNCTKRMAGLYLDVVQIQRASSKYGTYSDIGSPVSRTCLDATACSTSDWVTCSSV
jgi:hypothetical protein